MILGPIHPGATVVTFVSDTIRTNDIILSSDQHLVRLAAYMDSVPGSGGQLFRPVIATADGQVLGSGPQVTIQPAASPVWRSFAFDAPGMLLPAGEYRVGVHAGGTTNLAQSRRETAGTTRRTYSVAYGALGPTLPAPAATNAGPISMFLETLDGFVVPEVEDAALARLPWEVSQRVFGTTNPIVSTRRSAMATWHGTDTDPEGGAFCVVRTNGPLADLVGQRLRVAYRQGTYERVAYVFCHDELAFPDEMADFALSLSRGAMSNLAPLTFDRVPVIVEVLS